MFTCRKPWALNLVLIFVTILALPCRAEIHFTGSSEVDDNGFDLREKIETIRTFLAPPSALFESTPG